MRKQLLMIPGPTPCPDAVLRALSTQMINHRGPEYMVMQRELIAGLQEVFRTQADCLIFPASGTFRYQVNCFHFFVGPITRMASGSRWSRAARQPEWSGRWNCVWCRTGSRS